jgi:acetylornithine deacetylase
MAPIVLYDGTCGICHKSVLWLLRHVGDHVVLLAPLQGETGETLRAEIDAALEQAGLTEVKVAEVRLGKFPLYTPPTHPAASACYRALARAGCNTEPASVAFGTDAGMLAARGIPSLVLGPGSIARAHTEAEYVEIDQLERMVGVFEQLLEGA